MRHFLLSVCGEEQSLYEPLDSQSYISMLLLPTSKEGFAFLYVIKALLHQSIVATRHRAYRLGTGVEGQKHQSFSNFHNTKRRENKANEPN